MNRKVRDILPEILSPKLPSRKKRFIYIFISIPLDFLVLRLYFKIPPLLSLIIVIAFTVVFLLAFLWELKSEKKDSEFKDSLESDEYFHSEEWLRKYDKYRQKHDFLSVKSISMKSDLSKIYLKPSGAIITAFSVIFLIFAIFWRSGDIGLNMFLIVCGIAFLWCGLVKLVKTPVHSFLKKYRDELPHIERSYLNGKMLKFRCNGQLAENSGINIGGNYVVMYDSKNILAIDRKKIVKAEKVVEHTKCYINTVYSGAYNIYFISITYRNNDDNLYKFRIRLNEFQLEAAYRELSANHDSAVYTQKIRHDVGI